MNKDKKVVVFGATGNIGAYVTIELKKSGYDVYAVGKRTSDNGFTLEEQIKGIVQIFSPKDAPSKPDALQAKFDTSKTKLELGFMPEFTYLQAMADFYEEMMNEPFGKLWMRKEDYE